ncbi:D-glycero-beta-D-manno-heptose-7-phosphate kinase [Candidatus Desulfarcum epimagneticum]|uniref:D-glycero-beta-D-manno-heptose-7-phosphate kinase n=1 Tax=uncultured Desulfobacteraceae bacterium TaxID=218296 RepID=A0A484HKX1_9BACT|nr:D-glycero-beta-D-manno-heptose-7-phosphate kinase [uncultured Desulfobacteraceae bacterium]
MEPLLEKFSRSKILVTGDLMLDEYVWGEARRISPEAPVPVVSVEKTDHVLGGAGNVIRNLSTLGGQVRAVALAGDDQDADRIFEEIKALGVDPSGIIRDPGRPTTRKTRIMAAGQHVLRIDREVKKKISGDIFASAKKRLEDWVPEADLVIVSDYDKGFVTRDLMKDITALARKNQTPTLVDPKGPDFSKYAGARVITPNRKEAVLAARMDITDEPSLFEAGRRLLDIAGVEKALITCGKDGMALFEKGLKPRRITARPRQVFDVSGAGDTAIATLALALAAGAGFFEAARTANAAAGIVVGKPGTAAVSLEELEKALERLA